ncbi:MAG: hypothetical protein KBB64_02325 [Bacteroidia bacterium]|nr:hypothetical protein [Bacteroidia bacterium]
MSTESVDSAAFYMNPCSCGLIGAEKQTVGARLAGMGKKKPAIANRLSCFYVGVLLLSYGTLALFSSSLRAGFAFGTLRGSLWIQLTG